MDGFRKRGGKLLAALLPILLALIFVLLGVISLASLYSLNGNARVINYTGIVRGATQRLVKKELYRQPDDALIARLDALIRELRTGQGDNGLIALKDSEYQALLARMETDWAAIKREIGKIRDGAGDRPLFERSEAYFQLADEAVAAAETYTDRLLRGTRMLLIGLACLFILLFLLLVVYRHCQERLSRRLTLAEAASKEKSGFLSQMSHEIRTPMNGIIGMTAIAKRFLGDDARVADCLDKIELSSQFLLSLINDVLDMARIENGKVELQRTPFDLTKMIGGIEVMIGQRAQDGGVLFRVETGKLDVEWVMGDPLRTEQIIVNLLSNAVKFTPKGGCVTLEAQRLEKGPSEMLLFTVSDTGIGMSKEFMGHMFEPFAQEGSGSRKYGGTGLGLAISYHLATLMGGTIEAESELGKGARFTVTLPLEIPEAEALRGLEPSVERHEPRNFAGSRFLVAEDNEINAEIVLVMLAETGAEITHVWNGREAVEAFQASEPGWYGLILMDVQMPEMDGLAAAKAIRAMDRPDAASVPIVALTANAFLSDIEMARESGMTGYLSKPICVSDLYKMVNEQAAGPAAPPAGREGA